MVRITDSIQGVTVTPLLRISNPQGDVLRVMKASEPTFAGFGEAYFSIVKPGEVKAWKRHRSMTLNLVVPSGSVRFVIYDNRPLSETSDCAREVVLGSEASYGRLTVVPGLWFGFQGIGSGLNLVLNIGDIEHDPEEAERMRTDQVPFKWQ